MTDTFIVNYRKNSSAPTYRQYSGNIIEAVTKRLPKDSGYAVTDVIIKSTSGVKHRFTVSLKIGICLYQYINSGGRSQRMTDVLLKLTVETDSQKVTDVLAYDTAEWIGDALKRDGKLPKPAL